MVCAGTLAERGEGCGAADAERLANGVRGVEPHETEEAVGLDAGEQVSDLRRLTCGLYRARLGDENRVCGQ